MNIKGAGFDVNLFYPLKSAEDTGSVPKTQTSASAQERRRTDSVEISGQYGEDSGTFLTELKKKLAGSISQQPDAARLQTLHDAVGSGSYEANADELAQLMLK